MPEAGLRLLYLSRQDVEAVGLTMAEVIEAVESMFHEKGEGRVEMPPKPGIHTQPDAFIHAMPAYIPAFHSAGIKWVSGYPGNQQKGLPYITGLLILNDPETGIPLSVMDCTWITAMRTGAASAVAAKYLARPDAQTLGVLGCGVQGRSNLQALREVLPLRRVYAYDTHADTLKRYVREMAERFGLEVIGAVLRQIAIPPVHLRHQRQQQRVLRQLLQVWEALDSSIEVLRLGLALVRVPAFLRAGDLIPDLREVLDLRQVKERQLNDRKFRLGQPPGRVGAIGVFATGDHHAALGQGRGKSSDGAQDQRALVSLVALAHLV